MWFYFQECVWNWYYSTWINYDWRSSSRFQNYELNMNYSMFELTEQLFNVAIADNSLQMWQKILQGVHVTLQCAEKISLTCNSSGAISDHTERRANPFSWLGYRWIFSTRAFHKYEWSYAMWNMKKSWEKAEIQRAHSAPADLNGCRFDGNWMRLLILLYNRHDCGRVIKIMLTILNRHSTPCGKSWWARLQSDL